MHFAVEPFHYFQSNRPGGAIAGVDNHLQFSFQLDFAQHHIDIVGNETDLFLGTGAGGELALLDNSVYLLDQIAKDGATVEI